MQAGAAAKYSKPRSAGGENGKRKVMFCLIDFPHPVQIAFIKTVPDKLVQNTLINPGNSRGKVAAGFVITGQEPYRKNHKTDTDCRGDRFGKGPDIDDISVCVERLQGFYRSSGIFELGIVVVLKDITFLPALFRLRPLQQFRPSRIRHPYAAGILMSGHHIGQRAVRLRQSAHIDTGAVHRNGHDFIFHGMKNMIRAQVSRILHRDLPAIPEDLAEKHQKIVVTRADYDLLRQALNAS